MTHLLNCYSYTCICILNLLSCFCLVLVPSYVQSQNEVHFAKVEQNEKSQKSLAELSNGGKIFTIHSKSLAAMQDTDHSLSLFIDDLAFKDMNLVEVNLWSDEYKLYINETLLEPTSIPDIKFYKGFIPDQPNVDVRLSCLGEEVKIFINTGIDKYHIEQLRDVTIVKPGNYYILHKESHESNTLHLDCDRHFDSTAKSTPTISKKSISGCVDIEIAIAMDYSYLEHYGNNIHEAVYQTAHVMNMVNADYQSSFAKEINFKIVEHVVSTCEDCDPWTNSNDIYVLSDNFAYWADNGGFNHDHDIGQFWTKRDLKKNQGSSSIGYSFINGACTDKRYHILEEFASQSWQRRVLVSHEIAHNLGATHDSGGSSDIMNASLIQSNSWSAQSISQINSFLSSNQCAESCQAESCKEVIDVTLNEFTSTLLDLSWEYDDPNASFQVKLLDLNTSSVFFETITTDHFIQKTDDFPMCTDFMLTIKSLCSSSDISSANEFLISTSFSNDIKIVDIESINCNAGNQAKHDVQLMIEHQLSTSDTIYILVDNAIERTILAGTSPVILSVNDIASDGHEKSISLFTKINHDPSCITTTTYLAPNQWCDFNYAEDFNNCELPFLWTKTSTNADYFPYPYDWQIADAHRNISNYGKSNNANSLLTIDGTCMAVFDDDYSSNVDYTGIIELFSPTLDFTAFENVQLELDYIFHSFESAKGNANNSILQIDIWDGYAWRNILTDSDEQCDWENVWESNCIEHLSINLDQYRNPQFQIRFLYTDGNDGSWTGMAAIDNLTILGQSPRLFGCTDYSATNYNAAANVDDGTCYNCNNGIQDGTETDIDCGGINCLPCSTPCPMDHLYISEFIPGVIHERADTITVSAIIGEYNVSLTAGTTIKLVPGFKVAQGSSFSSTISPCLQ